MVKISACLATLMLWLLVGVSVAQGPANSPLPPNPCPTPNGGGLRLTLVASGVGTDAAGLSCEDGGGCAETMVVCYNRSRSNGRKIDVVVQLFDSVGEPAGTAYACDVPPGGSAAFVTSGTPFPLPYVGVLIPGPPVSPLGSLRVLDTRRKAVCDVTLIDSSGPALDLTGGGPLWTADVTVTSKQASQRGD